MKKFGLGKVLGCFAVFGVLMLIPFFFNLSIEFINNRFNTTFTLEIQWDKWCDFIAVVLPSALTYIVIKQSEQQQKEHMEAQDRLDTINKRMLEMELKSRLGYFIPPFSQSVAGEERRIPYSYDLKGYIRLENNGDDDVFVSSVKVINGNNAHNECADKHLYFSKKSPYNVLLINLKLSEEQLLEKQIDVKIEINMKNTKGYQYSQRLDIGFANHNGTGEINKFNMDIQEIDKDAD